MIRKPIFLTLLLLAAASGAHAQSSIAASEDLKSDRISVDKGNKVLNSDIQADVVTMPGSQAMQAPANALAPPTQKGGPAALPEKRISKPAPR